MESSCCLATITLVLVLLSHGAECGGFSPEGEALQQTLVQKMANIQTQLADVTNSIRSLDSDIETALFNCLGVHSDICDEIEEGFKDGADQGLSVWRQAKRSAAHNPELDRYRSLYAELKRKRDMARSLMGLFRGADLVLTNERKRSCNLNLGFHCQTEEIANFADVYDFLSSPHSPGKKRSVRSAP
ncbi:unnamed protein product [Lymnaea stagnalis]|uniref:Uncharacterized protein n=1 Tax=Lymnaea stagnalis TaxID=6523 RepID=A0AAV2H729_LYMST